VRDWVKSAKIYQLISLYLAISAIFLQENHPKINPKQQFSYAKRTTTNAITFSLRPTTKNTIFSPKFRAYLAIKYAIIISLNAKSEAPQISAQKWRLKYHF
jgi:hypothetical protein